MKGYRMTIRNIVLSALLVTGCATQMQASWASRITNKIGQRSAIAYGVVAACGISFYAGYRFCKKSLQKTQTELQTNRDLLEKAHAEISRNGNIRNFKNVCRNS